MKDYNNPNLSSQEVRLHQLPANQTVETIQKISKNIREYSFQMRHIMKALRESGAIPEIALAIREGSFAIRDVVKDINETTQEIRKNGAVNDTASAVEDTLKSAKDSITTVQGLMTDARRVSPNTTKAVQNSIVIVRKEASHVTGKVMQGVKNKVSA